MEEVYENNIEEVLNSTIQRTEIMSNQIIKNIINKAVDIYCQPIDDLIKQMNDIMESNALKEDILTDDELQSLGMKLSSKLYYASEHQEVIALKGEISKGLEREVLNRTFLSEEGTAANKTAVAEMNSQKEYLTSIIMNRVYKIIKSKVSAGYEILAMIKKVMDARMNSYNIERSVMRGRNDD